MTRTDLSPEQNELLDKVVALWKEADGAEDQADLLESEAANQRQIAEDKDEEAEALWLPLAQSTPEWEDMLRSGEDPREAEA